MAATSIETLRPGRQITLPWAFVFALMCAAASWGGAYMSMQNQIQRSLRANDEQSAAIIALATRVSNIESDERVNAVTRSQLEKDTSSTAGALAGFQVDVRDRLEKVQSTLIELQVTLGAIKEASQVSLPGDRKK